MSLLGPHLISLQGPSPKSSMRKPSVCMVAQKAFSKKMAQHLSVNFFRNFAHSVALNNEQSFPTAYSSQAQGQVERAQWSILTLMCTFVPSKQTDWDKYLYPFTWALNTSGNSQLGLSSFLLVFCCLPVFLPQGDLPDAFDKFSSVHATLSDMMLCHQKADVIATAHLMADQSKIKNRCDANATPDAVPVGDIVYVSQPWIRVCKTK